MQKVQVEGYCQHNTELQSWPALLGQDPLPEGTVSGTSSHGAQQVRVDFYHLLHCLWGCNTQNKHSEFWVEYIDNKSGNYLFTVGLKHAEQPLWVGHSQERRENDHHILQHLLQKAIKISLHWVKYLTNKSEIKLHKFNLSSLSVGFKQAEQTFQ